MDRLDVRLRRWAALVSDYAVAQIAVQGLGAAAGLVLVNVMPVREYALYALALSVITFVSIASDLGISNALLYFRRETRRAATWFMPYVVSALQIRRVLMLAGFAAAAAFMWHAASGQGFAALEILAALGMVLAALWFQIHASLNLLLLRVGDAFRASYVAEAAGNGARLLGAIAIGLSTVTTAWAGIAVGVLGVLLTARLSERALASQPSDRAPPSGGIKKAHYHAIWRYVLPMAASALYFAFQAPLMVWLSSYFGSTDNIAQVGALGRLSIVFGVPSSFIGTVILPRLAGVTDDRQYQHRYLACWMVLVPAGLLMLALVAAVPHWLLWPLGGHYAALEHELLLVVLTSVVMMWGGFAVAVNNARGWVRRQWLVLLVYITVQIVLVLRLDLTTTYGVILFGLCSAVAGTVLALTVNLVGFHRPRYVSVNRPAAAIPAAAHTAVSGADA